MTKSTSGWVAQDFNVIYANPWIPVQTTVYLSEFRMMYNILRKQYFKYFAHYFHLGNWWHILGVVLTKLCLYIRREYKPSMNFKAGELCGSNTFKLIVACIGSQGRIRFKVEQVVIIEAWGQDIFSSL